MKSAILFFSAALSLAPSVAATLIPFHRTSTLRSTAQPLSRRGTHFSTHSTGSASSKTSSLKNLATSSSGSDSDGEITLDNINDLLYLANVTIGGQDYVLQLDSGSSDLVLMTKSSSAKLSTVALNLTYGVGYAAGTVATAPVSFADLNVSSQAFLYATDADNPITSYGAVGIMGLGFTSLSNVDYNVKKADSSATWGHTFLYNAFAQSPKEPNYITFSLERASDESGESDGGFTIGELVDEYASIESTASIPTWPESNPSRWNVLADAYETSTGKFSFGASAVKDAPSGKAVVLLDTGTSYVYAPEDFVTAIYGSVSGANYSAAAGQWNVPCDAAIYLGIWIGGRRFDIHPLDLVVPSLSGGGCTGSFLPQSLAVGSGEFDIIAGDVFLRNMYSLYDFGDFTDSSNLTMGDPYVKLLSTTNITAAGAEFNKVRNSNSTLRVPSNSGDSNSTSSTTSPSSSTLTLQQLSDKVKKLQSYTPALIAVLAANAVIMLVLIGVLIFFIIRRNRSASDGARGGVVGSRRPRPFKRGGNNTLSTMELAGGPVGDDHDGSAKYEPVSMTNPDGTPAYETPAYRQSAAVSFRMNEGFRESAAL